MESNHINRFGPLRCRNDFLFFQAYELALNCGLVRQRGDFVGPGEGVHYSFL